MKPASEVLTELRERVDAALSEYAIAYDARKREKAELDAAREHVLDCEEAQKIVQLVAKTVQQRAHEKIATVVTHCLQAVYGSDAYTFRILFEAKRGRTEARLVFERDEATFDPTTETGGGVVDVAAFALRLSALLLHRPALRRVMILDEPFKMVSVLDKDGRPLRVRVAKLLEALSDELGVQFVLITHMPELRIGKVIDLQ